MYEKFSDHARAAMFAANEEARALNHEYIGTEHILLGLIEQGSCLSVQILMDRKVDPIRIRQEVKRLIQSGSCVTTRDKLPLTPRAKKVLEFAGDEAKIINWTDICSAHLLLGLLREAEGVASQVLTSLGLRLDEVRQQVWQWLSLDGKAVVVAKEDGIVLNIASANMDSNMRSALNNLRMITSTSEDLDAVRTAVGILQGLCAITTFAAKQINL